MKKILSIILSILMAFSLTPVTALADSSLTLPYSNDFSSENALDGWTLSNCVSGTGIKDGVFRFKWTMSPPQYLISPELPAAAGGIALAFKYYGSSETWPEEFSVGYSVTNNETDSFTWDTSIATSDGTAHDYYKIFPAATKYVAIRHQSYDEFYLTIDDVSITEATHTVSFNKGTGTGSMDPVDVEDGAEYTLPATCSFTKEGRLFYGWKIGDNYYAASEANTITVTADTEVTAVWKQTKKVDLSADNSTTTVKGKLNLTDTRTGEVYEKDLSETAASEFTIPNNSTVNAIIEETKTALLDEAKAKAGEYAVTVTKDEVSDPDIIDSVLIQTGKTVEPFDPSLGTEYPSVDEYGDLFEYRFTEGERTHYWEYTVTLEAEFMSEAPMPTPTPAPVLTPEEAAMPTEEKTEELVKKTNTDKKDVAGAEYKRLMLKATSKSKSITLKWKKINGASGYIIYGAPCGKKMTRLATVTNPNAVKYTFKNLKKGKYYKYVVVAYKKTAAGNRIMSKSKSVHVATPGSKKGNPTGIKLKKTKITLKKGKKTRIKATLLKKGKVATHIAKFRYESADTNIATVDAKGNIKAKKKGTVTIYVYAQNGLCKTIKVKVK